MAYKIFISHSTRSRELVINLSNLLTKFDIEVFVAEWYFTQEESIDKKIFKQIEKADYIVVLLTRNGIRPNWVQQEIDYAIKVNKLLIPFVEKGVASRDLAVLQGKKYIEYGSSRLQQDVINIFPYVKSLKLNKEEMEEIMFFAGSILSFLLFTIKNIKCGKLK